jgi:hypothetical protein
MTWGGKIQPIYPNFFFFLAAAMQKLQWKFNENFMINPENENLQT